MGVESERITFLQTCQKRGLLCSHCSARGVYLRCLFHELMCEMSIWGCEHFLSVIFSSACVVCHDVYVVFYGSYSSNYVTFIPLLSHSYSELTFMTTLLYFARLSREALRWTIFSMQATGHILLGSSCYIEQLLEEEEEERSEKGLALPQEGRIRQLQSMLLGKISYWRGTPTDEGGVDILSILWFSTLMKQVVAVWSYQCFLCKFGDLADVATAFFSQSLNFSVTYFVTYVRSSQHYKLFLRKH